MLFPVQVDLALEARHLWQFNYNFRHSRNVRFPYPIYPLVAPEVLVETYEAGEGISSYVADPGRSTFKSRCGVACLMLSQRERLSPPWS